ncbi:NKG2-D type II integral membrane protein [Sciurus carolinensis]|uniref:NKG2-D type II integral membrane protein n=1 Tax=Sciurus carolinensis TaxID=30640 RepID=A0AA41N5U7_SCICA|nr:NKG2-D type II integral membrane protein [Sciurus carolinensis]
MPQNKQNECILNKKEANYTEIKFFKCQQKRRIPKEKQGPIISSEEPVNYVQLKFIRTSHLQHKKCFVRGKKECSCDLSFHNWIGFGNSYYHFFNEAKTWPESRTACMELNSHLLRIETQEELDVLSTFGMVGWLGLKMNETDGSWLWEDGTDVKKSL